MSCIICNESSAPLVKIKEKGLLSLIDFSQQRNEETIYQLLLTCKNEGIDVFVHERCRKWFNNKRRISTEAEKTQEKKTRRSTCLFNWKMNCFLCGSSCHLDQKHPLRRDWHLASTIQLRQKILETCKCRLDADSADEWALEVQARALDYIDFVAAEARYHRNCRLRFETSQKLLTDEPKSKRSRGRRTNEEMMNSFNKACEWLEAEASIHSIPEFREKVGEFSDNDEAYDSRYLKKLLKYHYGGHISFSKEPGRETMIYFLDMANFIINNKFRERKEDIKEESTRIIQAAADLIRAEIREKRYDSSSYPTSEEITSPWIPDSLRTFMAAFTKSTLKQEIIGQCIVKLASPLKIPPILFALGVEVDHLYGSKWLNDELFKLGFSVSYSEVTRFKQASLVTQSLDDQIKQISTENSFTQFIADNVDHNIATLDGRGTFHGMGIIASTVSGRQNVIKEIRIKRPDKLLKVELTSKATDVPIVAYDFPQSRKFDILFKPSLELLYPYVLPETLNADVLWRAAGLHSTKESPRPNWSGYMQKLTHVEHQKNATITLLPIIDLSPTNYTCIYSTLLYVIDQCKKLDMTTPSITFNQPLWLKATEIAVEKSLNVVIHLGGFHTLMSFVGSIGSLMDGSGIESVLQTVYGENSIKQMLQGKAISRAVRAHILVESALTIKLHQMLTPDGDDVQEDAIDKLSVEDLEEIKAVCDQSTELKEATLASKAFEKLETYMEKLITHLSEKSITARLWLQYMQYVKILRQYILAARTGDWNLSLVSLHNMLNLFAATGHFNYAKSARLYLQQMIDLPITHPWLHQKLAVEGHHVIRRTDKYWAGLWPDLVIEQFLMRSLKSRGGLTRGRGMAPSVRMLWIHSMHSCAIVHNAMTALTDHCHKTSEQHEELWKSRIQRDFSDLQKILEWFDTSNPFDSRITGLQSLSTGLVADEMISCDNAEEVGRSIQSKLDGSSFKKLTMKRADQIKTFGHLKNVVKINKQNVVIDTSKLFTRLILLLERCDDITPYFRYELTPVPTALFSDNMMRKPNKSSLIQSLLGKDYQLVDSSDIVTTDHDVVDGGALLRKVVWKQGTTFKDIVELYRKHVRSNYRGATIVFDGYGNNPSTKDHEHLRRSLKSASCPNVKVQNQLQAKFNQHSFLSNDSNKMELISLMTPKVEADGTIVRRATDDADTMIVSAALQLARDGNSVTVFANDTDVIIMLFHFWDNKMANVWIRSEYTRNDGKQLKQMNVKDAVGRLKDVVVRDFLFIHAFGGCDTTSAVHDKGKTAILRLFQRLKKAQQSSKVFNMHHSSQEQVGRAGIALFVLLYGGKIDDTLNYLRYTSYMKMAASSSKITPAKLPPTERAAWFHSLRVYLQVCQWSTLRECDMNQLEWGWKMENGKMTPIMTDQDIAPEELLCVIRCNCKLSSRNPCGTNQCSCKLNGMQCVSACGDCRGIGCNNSCDEDEISDNEVETDEVSNEDDTLF